MPPRDQELPEGTDQIINGAMETGAGTGASTGSSGSGGDFGAPGASDSFGGTGASGAAGLGGGGFGGTGSGGTTPGGSADFAGTTSGTGAAGGGSGFIGAGGTSDDTGGLAGGTLAGDSPGHGGSNLGGGTGGEFASAGGGGAGLSGGGSDFGGGSGGGGGSGSGSGDFGGTGGGSGGGGVTAQAKSGVQGLKSQATDKVRTYAEDGKSRATSALDDLAQLVQETAQSIDDKLGPQYGDYARRAAGTVTDFSERLREKEVDELFDDARQIVRKSPGVAIGVAAVAGFALVRLLKAGMDTGSGGGGTDVEFTPDPTLSSGSTSLAGSTSVDSQAPYVTPGTGV